MRVFSVVISALTALGALAGEIDPASFACTGQMKDDVCWLTGARLYGTASWHFVGLTPGQWTLILEALSDDWCAKFGCQRDVTVQVFWREGLDQPWNWRFLVLRKEIHATCKVRGEVPVNLSGPELFVLVQRAVLCDPVVGFSLASAYLRAAVEPPPPPPPKPVQPAPPPPQVCEIDPVFACAPGEVPPECLPANLNLETVSRLTLSDTYGHGDAQALDLGHYLGELGPGDYQDWYKFSAPKGEGRLLYFQAFGDLEVDLYLVHDPCGTDLAACLSVRGPVVIQAPCQAGMECVTIPDGPTECFPGPRCRFFLRIAWRSGSGQYFLSILPTGSAP